MFCRLCQPTIYVVNLTSKYFDSIRIAPRKAKGLEGPKAAENAARAAHRCEWADCPKPATNRAPKTRANDNQPHQDSGFRWFCNEHIREFNQNYDYFQGMSDEEVAKFQRDARTGHRPTWGLGVNSAPEYRQGFEAAAGPQARRRPIRDPYGLFGDDAKARASEPRKRTPRTLERQALDTLGLDENATLNDIKSRYKELVKQHHPDANGGDRSAEERLRKVIQAYDYLRKSGFC